MELSMEPVIDTKIPTETVNQILPATAPALELNVHQKGVVGGSLRYSQAKKNFEVEGKKTFLFLIFGRKYSA